MNPQVFEKTLFSFLRRSPFHPFAIELTDGDSLVVGSARALNYGGGGTAIYFGGDREPLMFHNEAVRRIVELVPVDPGQ